MDSSQQRSFWDRHITSWSDSAYNKARSMPLIERVAQPFRKHLPLRQHLAVEIVVNSGATSVLELGCGTGDFAVELIGTSKTLKNYLGMDIAASAVKEAREHVLAAAGSNVKAELRVSAVEDLDPSHFGSFDFMVGLGLLPYLTDEGLRRLSAICKGKKWVMDYHPREASFFNFVHAGYRAVKRYPFYRMFSDADTKELLARFGFAPYKLISHGPLRMMESV
jgi:2-polyprenyl-3-methyl-5-hydroxy-6-metoxy-1,4-benzoquinol methylase